MREMSAVYAVGLNVTTAGQWGFSVEGRMPVPENENTQTAVSAHAALKKAKNCPTPEMIAAGVAALRAYSPYFETEEEGVEKIYLAMESSKNLA